jgi:hypothetical protein
MPLSEYEERILSEIERRLAADDPNFARDVAAHTPYGQSLKKLKRAALLFAGGFALLIAGLIGGLVSGGGLLLIVLGVAAFAVMLSAIVVIASTMKSIGREHVRSGRAAVTPRWFARWEERWRQRFERDDDA